MAFLISIPLRLSTPKNRHEPELSPREKHADRDADDGQGHCQQNHERLAEIVEQHDEDQHHAAEAQGQQRGQTAIGFGRLLIFAAPLECITRR